MFLVQIVLVLITSLKIAHFCDFNNKIIYETASMSRGVKFFSGFNLTTYENTDFITITNNIPVLCNKLFNIRHTFSMLIITSCNVQEIEPEFLLGQQYQPETLFISGNGIKTIKKHTFKNLTIQEFWLGNNQIEVLENEAFTNLELQRLDLNSNQIKDLNCDAFKHLPNLVELDLRSNRIQHLKNQCFEFIKLDNATIRLDNNQIWKIERGVFDGMTATNLTIDLQYNKIEQFPVRIFQNHVFAHFNLTGNRISHLIFDVENITNVEELEVDDNLDQFVLEELGFFAKHLSLQSNGNIAHFQKMLICLVYLFLFKI